MPASQFLSITFRIRTLAYVAVILSASTLAAAAQLAQPGAVTRDELAPVMSADGSGLPHELWRGLDLASLEGLINDLEIPPRSPALHALWKRLITAQVAPSGGGASENQFAAVRLDALYRSGLAEDAAKEFSNQSSISDPLLAALYARNLLASGKPDEACKATLGSAGPKQRIAQRMRANSILMSGYCAARASDVSGAGLAADIAREEGFEQSPTLDALDAISIGAKAKRSPVNSLSLIDYRIIEKAGGVAAKDVLEKGEPALLVALANDPATPADLGLPASDAAARLNALTPETLAAIYRANGKMESADALIGKKGDGDTLHRASLFKSAEAEKSPMAKARLIRAFLDYAERAQLRFQAMQMIAPALQSLRPEPGLANFAEMAASIALTAGQYDEARRWTALDGNLGHWSALIDLADPKAQNRDTNLAALEPLAERGAFQPDTLHRLATVLDALDTIVPIPLWDAASRTPQPAGGYLPATGVLSELQDAAKKKEFGRTVLLTMKALGPNGAEGAHMIALGDSIRALKRAGLDPDARRLGLEALLAAWPRTATQ